MTFFTKRLLFILLPVAICQCTDDHANVVITPRDTTITPQVAITDLYLDSLQIAQFIDSRQLEDSLSGQIRSFYNSRNFQYGWFNKNGLAQQAMAFWNLYDTYLQYSKDSSVYNPVLSKQMNLLITEDSLQQFNKEEIKNIELSLTRHFFVYARYAYGGKADPSALQWHIPRKKINAISLLDSLIKTNGANIEEWEPINPQYRQVKKFVLQYYDIEKSGQYQPVDATTIKALKEGDRHPALPQIKQNLSVVGDMTGTDTTDVFTPALTAAVQHFQKRLGLVPDGVIGGNTLAAMNVPISKRIEQMLVNMERMRWFPQQSTGNFILVNIPDFKLHVFENFKKQFDINIVVGKSSTGTVIFSDSLKYIVFSPYWNVPSSIVRNEIQPAMQRNGNYLQSHNMEITGYNNGVPVVRQKPGGDNALGLVKFIFPNHFNIYFHDTPAKSLFESNTRAFSHGCIRLEEPVRLANYLLRNQPEWTDQKIYDAMHNGTEKWVPLQKPVPVFITYFTTFVNAEGNLQFRNDVYHHDEELADILFDHT